MQPGVKHVPTEESRKLVKELYSMGIPQVRIAKRFDIDPTTLIAHYRKELDEAKDIGIAELGRELYRDAMNGDQKAREFYLSRQGGWVLPKEVQDQNGQAALALLEKAIDKL